MSDKVKQMENKVVMVGRITEFEKTIGTSKKNVPYIRVKGTVQFGDHKAQVRHFEKYVQEYSTNQDGSKKKDNKNYPIILAWANGVKSVANSSWEEATEVSLQCSIATNDYVNREDRLVEGLKYEIAFVNDVDGEYGATADVEGYIQSITPEVRGDNQDETGRLKVTVLTNDFFGNVIPVKNIIVPKDLREVFEDNYEVGQTAKLFINLELHKGKEKPKKAGGIGIQRVTEGKSYVEMILTGADPAIDEDEEGAYTREAVRIGLAERKAELEKLKEEGYQGDTSDKRSISSASRNTRPAPALDEDIPF